MDNSEFEYASPLKKSGSPSGKEKFCGSYLVLDGAMFVCSQGAVPNSIVASGKKKVYAQNRKVVTTDDTSFLTPVLPFGTCRLSTKTNAGQPCEYANGAWDEQTCYNSMVLDSSKMYCSACTPRGGEISCIFHGQQRLVTMKDILEFDVDKASAISPFAYVAVFDKPDAALQAKPKKTKPREGAVNSIEVKFPPKREGGEARPVGRHLRQGEKIILEAKSKKDLTGVPISWILFQKEEFEDRDKRGRPVKATRITNLMIIPKVGTPFPIKLKKLGVYYFEAVGTTNGFASLMKYYAAQKSLAANNWVVKGEKLPLDPAACKCVEVCENSILSLSVEGSREFGMDGFVEQRWANDDLVDFWRPRYVEEDGVVDFVPQGANVGIKVETAHTLDHEWLACYVNGKYFGGVGLGAIVSYEQENGRYVIALYNAGTYVVRVVLRNKRNLELSSKEVKIVCVHNIWDVSVRSGSEENPLMVRPGVSLNFAVKYDGAALTRDSKIAWRWGKAIMGKNKKKIEKVVGLNETMGNTLTFITSNEDYDLWVEALAVDRECLYKNAKKYGDGSVWTYVCKVMRNRVLRISLEADEHFVGIPYILNLEYLYPEHNVFSDGEVKCTIDGEPMYIAKGACTCVVEFWKEGGHTIKAWMGSTPEVTLKVDVSEITVSRWGFIDSANCTALRAAFGTPVTVVISIPAFRHLPEEKRAAIRLEVCDDLSGDWPFSLPLADARFDGSGVLRAEFRASDLTTLRNNMRLRCVLVNLPCSVVGISEEKWEGRSGYPEASKLLVSQSEYVKGFFASNSNNPQKSILRYGADAKIVLYLYNVEKAKLENCTLLLVENDHEGDWRDSDTILWSLALPLPDDTGRVEIPIPEDCIVEAGHNPETPKSPRLFYFVVVYKDPSTGELSPFYAYPLENPKADFKVEVTNEGLKHIDCNYFWQLKYVPEGEGEMNDTLAHFAQVVIGEPLNKGEGRPLAVGTCPRCREKAELMLERLLTIDRFAKSAEAQARLRVICETYTQYAESFYMDTCWMKAHFFAQASVESGALLGGKAENMGYTRENFESKFSSRIFHTGKVDGRTVIQRDEDGNKKYLPGMKERVDKLYTLSGTAFQKEAACIAYNGLLGNGDGASSIDGWTYRGGGLVQVTGKSNYEAVQRSIKSFAGVNESLMGAEQLQGDFRMATLSAMAYLAKRKIHLRKVTTDKKNVSGMQFIANGQRNEYFVSKLVGNEHKPVDGKTNYDRKQEFFDEFYKALKVGSCDWNEEFSEDQSMANIYRIDLDRFSAYKYQENKDSDEFIYKVYNNGKKVAEYTFKSMDFAYRSGRKFLLFPQKGPNWDRYGRRDENTGKNKVPEDGDNCISEENCACFLGLLYSLPLNGHDEMIYYDDITVSFSNGGHSCHQFGHDIDLRYPKGSSDARNSWDWTIKNEFNGDKEAFVKHLESFLAIAKKWGYENNYAIETVRGATQCRGHESHLHIGNTYFKRYK